MSWAALVLLALVALVVVAWAAVLVLILVAHWRFVTYLRFKGRVPHVRGRDLFGYWWRESLAMLIVGLWHVAGRLASASRTATADRPVVLVHGFTQNRTNFFGLARRLEARGRPVIAPDLGRPFLGGMERYAIPLERALEEAARRSPDGSFDVVAHSMGGLVLRMVLAARPDLAAGVRQAVTLGAPHAGTAGARGLSMFLDAGAMRRSSPLYMGLPTLVQLLPHARVITMAAAQDYVVYPVDTCHVDGAEQVTFPRPGHTGLLLDPEVLNALLHALAPERYGADRGGAEGMAGSSASV